MKLDLKDKKILTILEMDARISLTQLAKQVKLSKQVVKYRMEKLEKENIIQQYYAIIDMAKLGYTLYVIYFKLQHLTNKQENEWIRKINQHLNVLAVGRNATHMDLTIPIRAKNNEELSKILDDITESKKENIQKTIITSELESTYFNLKLLHNKNTKEVHIKESKLEKIDTTDNRILEILSQNSRTTLVDIAQQVNLSANGVKFRMKNLEKKGIIAAYKTKVNYEKLGYLHFRVFLHLKQIDNKLYNSFKTFLKAKGSVESVNRYLGYCEFDFRCWTKGILELYKLISELKDKYPQQILSTDSIINFGWQSMDYYKK